MSEKPNIFAYGNYRTFLADFLESRKQAGAKANSFYNTGAMFHPGD